MGLCSRSVFPKVWYANQMYGKTLARVPQYDATHSNLQILVCHPNIKTFLLLIESNKCPLKYNITKKMNINRFLLKPMFFMRVLSIKTIIERVDLFQNFGIHCPR
jgi:hypothetical protein